MNRFWTGLAIAVIGFLCTGIAAAQNLTISGTVSDEKKAVVAGVKVVLRDPAGIPTEASTTADGEFKFESLRSGSYEISFSKEDYQSTTRTLTLTDEPRTVDVALGLGRITTSLDVTDSADINTATRLYISDLEVPAQTSVISQQTLREQNINDLITALENVSGVTTQLQYGSMEWYTIGGIAQQSGIEYLYIDGMASTGNRSNTQLSNIESVEVIKGPNALMLGGGSGNTGAAGGAINVTRKKPQAQAQQEILYRFGRWGLQEFGASTTGRVFGSNKFLYRSDLGWSSRDGWRNAGGTRFNLSPVATYLINESGRITVQQSYSWDRFTEDGGLPIALYNTTGFPIDRKFNPPGEFDLYRDWQTQVRFEYNLGHNIRLQDQFFTQKKRERYLDSESLTYNANLFTLTRTEATITTSNRRPKQNYVTLTGAHHFLWMDHQWAASYNYQDHYFWQERHCTVAGATNMANVCNWTVLPTPLNLNTWLQPGFVDNAIIKPNFNRSAEQFNTYSNNIFNIQDHIDIIKGRLSVDLVGSQAIAKRRIHTDTWDPATDTFVSRGNDTFAGNTQKAQHSNNYRAGLTYFIVPRQLSVYFVSATNFSPITSPPANLAPGIDPNDLKAALGRQYAFGAKWLSQGGRLKIGVEAGKNIAQNQFVTLTDPASGINYSYQVGQQSAKRADVDVEGLIGWGVRATAVYGYAACRYDTPIAAIGGTPAGRRCMNATRHAGRTFLTKQLSVGTNSKINLSIGMTVRSKTPLNSGNPFTYYGGWTRFDAAVGYQFSNKWSATANIQNLFNRQRYITSTWGSSLYPGPPINATFTLRYQFNHDPFSNN